MRLLNATVSESPPAKSTPINVVAPLDSKADADHDQHQLATNAGLAYLRKSMCVSLTN
jgi:hypothetical protein